MKNLYLALPILLMLVACNPSAPASTAEATQPAPTPQVDPVPPADARQAKAQPTTGADLLQGKWRSDDDPSNVLEFAGGKRIEGGDSEPYTLGDHCTNPTDNNGSSPAEKDRYISCDQSDLCWYIVELTADRLSLSYMGRGNTLNYTRIQ